jgi:hypothetical protein
MATTLDYDLDGNRNSVSADGIATSHACDDLGHMSGITDSSDKPPSTRHSVRTFGFLDRLPR